MLRNAARKVFLRGSSPSDVAGRGLHPPIFFGSGSAHIYRQVAVLVEQLVDVFQDGSVELST